MIGDTWQELARHLHFFFSKGEIQTRSRGQIELILSDLKFDDCISYQATYQNWINSSRRLAV